ncbi:hypothetical protein LVJ94_23960 [Pendulispora rubella]|uniref:Uncharacterized protein n=1 Tax=Pendulispora rubella TaxID=2741070 RepID=A0ABZ2LM59_9BACT
MRAKLLVGLGILFAALLHARPASAVQIVDGDFHVDIVPDEGEETCVTLPESLHEPESCDGVDIEDFNQRLRKAIQGDIGIVASVLVRGDERFEFVVILREANVRTEFDKATARAFAQGGVQGLRNQLGEKAMRGVGDITPTEMRRNGVQMVGYEIVATVPPEDEQHATSALIQWTAATAHGRYTMTFASSPEQMPPSRALVERSLSSLRATPGARPPSAIVHMIIGAAMLGGVLLALIVGLYFLVRTLMRPSQPPKTYYGYNAPPPPPPAA